MKGYQRQRSKTKDTWLLTVDLGRDPATGKRRQLFETVQGKLKAQTRLAEMVASAKAGFTLRPERITVAEYLRQWLNTYASTNLRPRTAEGYESKLRKHVIPRIGNVALRNLEPAMISGVYKAALDNGLSPRSVLHAHRVLKEALEHAVTQGYIARNPCQALTPPRPERKEMRWLNLQELQRVLAAAQETPYYAAFYTALFTGLRRSELLGLRVRDIDLTLSTVRVSRALHTLKGGKVVVTEPKTDKGRRSVALTPSNAVVLRDHLDKLRDDMALLGLPMNDDTLLFAWPDGRPLLPSTLTHNWLRLVRRAGLAWVRLHDARHTHASLMLAQNVHPKIVQERLGHSSIAITLDLYSHAVPGIQPAAALGFDQTVKTAPIEAPAAVG